MRRTALATIGLAIALTPFAPASAAGGCTAFPNLTTGGGANCRYIATGPATFYASPNISNWLITATDDGGKTWRTLAGSRALVDPRIVPGQPANGVNLWLPATGTIDTKPGDLVDVAIGLAYACPPTPPCQKVRMGMLHVTEG